MNNFHTSALLKEAIEYLNPMPGKKYIDATLGGGGHSLEILKRGGIVLGIDVDQEAIDYVEKNLKSQILNLKNGERLKLVRGNFKDIKKVARLAAKQTHLNNFQEVKGIIFDLGVSSYQINTPERGFSFLKTGPLDMRMDKSLNVKASDLVNTLTKGELYELFSKLGETHRALAISDNIVRSRRIKPIETTEDLVRIILDSYGLKKNRVNDRTKARLSANVFQALRITVNDELNNLKKALPQSVELLKKGGRLVVITFHSLEDRTVKNSFKDFEKKGLGKILTKKVVKPGFEEIRINKRARSAKLRAFEKI